VRFGFACLRAYQGQVSVNTVTGLRDYKCRKLLTAQFWLLKDYLYVARKRPLFGSCLMPEPSWWEAATKPVVMAGHMLPIYRNYIVSLHNTHMHEPQTSDEAEDDERVSALLLMLKTFTKVQMELNSNRICNASNEICNNV
jgi:hypothetical protein